MKFWKRTTELSKLEVAQLIADVARLERENRKLTEMSIIDRCDIAEQRKTIAELEQRIADASVEIDVLTAKLANAERMRQVISKCRDDAEAKANGYGHYVPGAV